jgi:alkylation response protein AidB-like acyl-CoA dehydrogenase
MAKLKSTKVADEAIYSCLQMLGGYGYMEEVSFSSFVERQSFGANRWWDIEILKEILSK